MSKEFCSTLIGFLLFIAIVFNPPIVKADPPTIPLPYHNGATLVCSDCHTMHASQQHSFTGGTSVSPPNGPPENYPWSTTPTANLLRRATSAEVCLSCHDNQSGVPDVITDDANGLGNNRGGGFFATLNTASYKGHNLNKDASPSDCNRCHNVHRGWPPTNGMVTCIDCHYPHGYNSYRNLRRRSYHEISGQPKVIAFVNPSITGIQKYSQNNIGFSAPSSTGLGWAEVAYLCSGCHNTFTSTSDGRYTGSTSPYKRHPGTNSQEGVYFPINKTGANTDPTNWVNGTNGFSIGRLPFLVRGATDFVGATTVAANNEVFCLSCHKAHGSNNSFGLRWGYGSDPSGAIQQAGCEQCHNK